MKKLFLILIPVLLLVIPNKCEAKYILEKTTKVSVNIQTPVSLTITDINNRSKSLAKLCYDLVWSF